MTATERTAWLMERRTGLGATDLASLCGVGFRTPLQVYESKVDPTADDELVHPLLRIGLATEQLNAELYAARTGTEVLRPEHAISRHSIHPWAMASLDRLAMADGVATPLELKYTPFFGERWGEEFTEQIPDAYLVQVQWQMYVTDAHSADVSVLSGTGDHRIYRVPRSDGLAGLLLDVARRFWHDCVLAQVPPTNDWCQQFAGAVTERLEVLDRVVEPVLGPEAEVLADEYQRAKGVAKEAEAIADRAKERLTELMGSVSRATAGRFQLSRTLVEGGKEVRYLTKPYVRFGVRATVQS
jgi:putative phage-type endonuclease